MNAMESFLAKAGWLAAFIVINCVPSAAVSAYPMAPGAADRSIAFFASAPWDHQFSHVTLAEFAFLTESELSREAGLSAHQNFAAESKRLADLLASRMPTAARRALQERCNLQSRTFERQGTPDFRPSIENLACLPFRFESLADEPVGRASNREKVAERRHWTWEEFSKLAGMGANEVFFKLDAGLNVDYDNVVAMARRVKLDCRFAGVFAALTYGIESYLPDKRAALDIEEFYEEGSRCLKPSDDGYERLHLRVGLLRASQGKIPESRAALLLALQPSKVQEEHRALFWLGVFANAGFGEKGVPPESDLRVNLWWNILIRKYPHSLHGVIAAHQLGIDPFSLQKEDRETIVSRRVGDKWDEFNCAAWVSELLIARRDEAALRAWANLMNRSVEVTFPTAQLFMGAVQARAGNHRLAILNLTRYVRALGESTISPKFLDLFYPKPYISEITNGAGDVDPNLLFALIRQESAFDPMARSHADARGLMQVIPATARRMARGISKNGLYDPTTNIRIGTKFLARLTAGYQGRVEDALAGYNAGPGALARWRQRFPTDNQLLFSDLIPYRETRQYVAVILRNAYWYGRLLTKEGSESSQRIALMSTKSRWKPELVALLLKDAWSGFSAEENRIALESRYLRGISERKVSDNLARRNGVDQQ